MSGAAQRINKLLAAGAGLDVRGDGLLALGGKFAVEVGHDFFWCDRMWGRAHRPMPFCGIVCGAPGDGAGSAEGSSKLRRAVRARKRRERTVLMGSSSRSAISA